MTKISSTLALPMDAPALVAVWNRLYHGQPVSENAFSFAENRYLLACAGEVAVGHLEVGRSRREGDPDGKLWAYLTLSPGTDEGEKAVVRALYGGLEALPDARVLYTMAHETQAVHRKVLKKLG